MSSFEANVESVVIPKRKFASEPPILNKPLVCLPGDLGFEGEVKSSRVEAEVINKFFSGSLNSSSRLAILDKSLIILLAILRCLSIFLSSSGTSLRSISTSTCSVTGNNVPISSTRHPGRMILTQGVMNSWACTCVANSMMRESRTIVGLEVERVILEGD